MGLPVVGDGAAGCGFEAGVGVDGSNTESTEGAMLVVEFEKWIGASVVGGAKDRACLTASCSLLVSGGSL